MHAWGFTRSRRVVAPWISGVQHCSLEQSVAYLGVSLLCSVCLFQRDSEIQKMPRITRDLRCEADMADGVRPSMYVFLVKMGSSTNLDGLLLSMMITYWLISEHLHYEKPLCEWRCWTRECLRRSLAESHRSSRALVKGKGAARGCCSRHFLWSGEVQMRLFKGRF